MGLSVDASNSCIPPNCNLIAQTPPLPKTERGIPIRLEGSGGRLNSDRPLIAYPSGRLVVIRELTSDLNVTGDEEKSPIIKSFVYRGHTAEVTVAKFSPSGCYVASADVRGKLRVWSYDNEEHLCRLELSNALAGPIRDLAWDFESKRIILVGEGSRTDPNSVCAKVIQWDTGVTLGNVGQHARLKASTCAFKPNRPMRIATGGAEDFKCLFNKGPPFGRVPVVEGTPAESCHVRGAVHCMRYNHDGSLLASVGTDKSVIFYDGKTMQMLQKMEKVHMASIYECAWNANGTQLLTCSADGTAKLISYQDLQVIKTWNVAQALVQGDHSDAHVDGDAKVPLGGMIMGCAFVHGDIPVAISLNGKVAVLPTADKDQITNTPVPTLFLTGHQAPISSLAIHHESGIMYTGDSNGVICQWDTSGNAIGNVQRDASTEEGYDDTMMNKVHTGAITGLECSQDGSLLSIGWDDKLRMSTTLSSTGETKLEAQPNAICRGSELVVIMTVNGLFLVREKQITSDLITLPYEATSICVSLDDSTVYVGGRDNNIHVYTVNGNHLDETHQMTGAHAQPVYSLALSNDGTIIASADTRDICLWNVEKDYEPIIGKSRWCFHQQKIMSLAWSNDDSVLASGGNDDSIYLWSLKKKTTRVHYSFAHRGGISCLEFLRSCDRKILLSVGNDGCVNHWDVTDDTAAKFGL